MRCPVLLAILLEGCRKESVAVPGHVEIAVPSAAPAPAATVAVCPPVWPETSPTEPAIVLGGMAAVCIEDRRFEGAELRELAAALGDKLSSGQRPKCGMGYPQIVLLTQDGRRATLTFCGAAERGYFSDLVLEVKSPESVNRWLRARGLLHLP